MIKCPYCNGIGKKVDKVKNGDRVIAVVYVCKACSQQFAIKVEE